MEKKGQQRVAILLVTLVWSFFLLTGCATNAASEEAPSPSPTIASTPGAQATPAEDPDRIFDAPFMGIRFSLPEAWYTGAYQKGNVVLGGYENGLEVSYLTVEGMAIMYKLQESIAQLPADATGYTPEQMALIGQMDAQRLPVCHLLVEYNGKEETELRGSYSDTKKLGEAGNTIYTLLYSKTPDMSKVTGEDKTEYEQVLAAMWDIEKDVVFTGHKSVDQLTGEVSFSSNTLLGLPIDGSILLPYQLTAINIWATWCGPCVAEMPDLQKLYEQLPEGVNLLGVCLDGAEEPDLAKQILEQTGVKYENVIANEDMLKGFLSYVQAYPTTLFVDSTGTLVGAPVMGAPQGDVVEGYLKAINERLALLP